MIPIEPDTDRHAPFLEAGTEVFGAIYRVHDGDQAIDAASARERLFADESNRGQRFTEMRKYPALQPSISRGYRAPVRLVLDIVASLLKLPQIGENQVVDRTQHAQCSPP